MELSSPTKMALAGGATALVGTAGVSILLKKDLKQLAQLIEEGKSSKKDPDPKKFVEQLQKTGSAESRNLYRTYARRAALFGTAYCVLGGLAAASFTMYQLQLDSPKQLGDVLRVKIRGQRESVKSTFADPLIAVVDRIRERTIPSTKVAIASVADWYRNSAIGQWTSEHIKSKPREGDAPQDPGEPRGQRLSAEDSQSVRDFLASQSEFSAAEKRSFEGVLQSTAATTEEQARR